MAYIRNIQLQWFRCLPRRLHLRVPVTSQLMPRTFRWKNQGYRETVPGSEMVADTSA